MIISDPISMYVCKASLPTLWSEGFNIIYEGIMMHMTTCLLENECLTKPLMKSFCEKILRADPSFIENTIVLAAQYQSSQQHSRVNPLFSKQIVLPLLLPLFLLFILPYFLKRVINGLKKENSTLCGIIKYFVESFVLPVLTFIGAYLGLNFYNKNFVGLFILSVLTLLECNYD